MNKSFTFEDYYLRKPNEGDGQAVLEICRDWDVMEYYGEQGNCKSLEQAENQLRWALGEFEKNGGRWIIADQTSDSYIGEVGFHGFEKTHRRAEIGYRLQKAYWGRGIMSAFISQLLHWGFLELNYNRVEALVDPRNPASARTLVKNGFRKEGLLREYEFEYGYFIDLEMYSILKRDFL